MTTNRTIKATWDGPRRHFPSLGATVEAGDVLNIPASLADEDSRWVPAKAKQSTATTTPAAAGDNDQED